ncbi:3-keto-5-aminohexanoate cleavage protein [Zavarzinia sp. CC-PAN008]|uniref:3-keto-5-aminohexanoate cleavage protein n=1 Tax=Zavarzinia sp. CC-PAN008 TaxID=3243332 RepID=UPI003F742117
MTTREQPAIIEAAINGATSRRRNPHVPLLPEEVAADALACLNAGAAIIHNHVETYDLGGAAAAARYRDGWRPVLAAQPDAILCPTIAGGTTPEERWGHFRLLAGQGGATMAVCDPGSVNLAAVGPDGLPGKPSLVYANAFEDIGALMRLLGEARLGPSIAIYEPGFLRATLAWARAGQLPAGTLVKLYFGGDYSPVDGRRGNVTFGLPPTAKALDAYLEMLEGSGLPWAVAVFGGDVVETGLARLALERGGHVRVGLEDHAGADKPSNRALVEQVAALCREVGRPPASCAQAAEIMALPLRATA